MIGEDDAPSGRVERDVPSTEQPSATVDERRPITAKERRRM
jgi:hypothetical protein